MIDTSTLATHINGKINTIKLFLYKSYPEIFSKLDFDDDSIFCNPLLFAVFRQRLASVFSVEEERDLISGILQGYFTDKEKEIFLLGPLFNFQEIAYLPNVGYFKKNLNNKFFNPLVYIEGSKMEILRCSTPALKFILENIPEEDRKWDDKIYSDNIKFLTNAYHFIKKSIPKHHQLIEQCCSLIYLFKTDYKNSNSFSSGNALGSLYFNVYQDTYDEVFFVDDIAHQSGHTILNNHNFNPKDFYKINPQDRVEDIIKRYDHRNVNVLVHALYTYYTTFLCMDACIEHNCFNEKQKTEAIARIGFYVDKCSADLEMFKEVALYYGGIDNMVTESGLMIIEGIIQKHEEVLRNWSKLIKSYDYSNQEYNYNHKLFLENNISANIKVC
ncbi:MAG: hypothetical protein JWQ63_1482 [Mucilaginibacter sp.]|nr:hypothetical protein [Mucilaginibacter sp.]